MTLFISHYDRVGGKALFTRAEIKAGDIVHRLRGSVSKTASRESIEIGPNQHITDPFGIYMNHSSKPTTYIDGRNVVATRDLYPGEEINFDYNASETNVVSRFIDQETGIEVRGCLGM